MGDTSSQIGTDMEERARAELIEEYFSSSGVGAPEVEGHLWLKAEGKKTWKKFYFVLRTSGLYYAPKGKKTSKDLVCLARFDVNQVYFGVKWQPKFKSPSKHCFAIKHPQIQAKNPKYIRYLCADTELELNKWVTGIRLAKYGRTLFENYRGIIEEIAHEDIDRLASARHSVNSHQNLNPTNGADAAGKSDLIESNYARLNHTPPVTTTTVIVHSSPTGGVTCHSSRSSSASVSEKSGSLSHSAEHGFSCDSPEGGTIKKKPQAKSSLVTFKPENEDPSRANGNRMLPCKEVRFKDTFSTIPSDDDIPFHREQTYATMRKGVSASNHHNDPLFHLLKPLEISPHEHYVYQNIDSILASHKLALQNGESEQPIKRRYSNESLVSNPQMLHSGTIIAPSSQNGSIKGSPSPPSEPTARSNNVQLSPQPIRPAPVLKPQISRKPSLDKNILMKKTAANLRQFKGRCPAHL